MAGNPPVGQGSSLVIPDDLLKKHPKLIELIKGSESMNDEERQYWINILPIMTPEQIQNLREILENERKQLQAINEKYAKEIESIGQAELLEQSGEERRRKRTARQSQEESHKETEEKRTEELLRAIEEQG